MLLVSWKPHSSTLTCSIALLVLSQQNLSFSYWITPKATYNTIYLCLKLLWNPEIIWPDSVFWIVLPFYISVAFHRHILMENVQWRKRAKFSGGPAQRTNFSSILYVYLLHAARIQIWVSTFWNFLKKHKNQIYHKWWPNKIKPNQVISELISS
jgi:hypothetical protein